MSFKTWHDYGYGICTDDIESKTTVERIENLLACAPKFRETFRVYADYANDALETVEDYLDYAACGIAALLAEVIEEAEGISFAACDNFDGENFLIYLPRYPWSMNEKDVTLSTEALDEILRKYVSILTDIEISIGYQEIENGG